MKQGWKIKYFEWGHFALDGGAMFGSIPKVLWSKLTTPDDQNRIPLSLSSLLLEKDNHKVFVDLGMGIDWEDKYKKIYSLDAFPLDHVMKKNFSFAPKDVTHIILSHLHFDHCGFLTSKVGSEFVSNFPNAEIFLIEENYKNALSPHPREAASYIKHIWNDPMKKGQFTLVNCQWMELREILPGISFRRVDGHTRGQGIVYIDGAEEDSLFIGDLCPTRNHLRDVYVMGYDMNAALSVQEKIQVFSDNNIENRKLYFPHSV